MFEKTQRLWFEKTPLSHWNGPTLMAVDGAVWRTPDTPENDAAFFNKCSEWPQVRMVCQMEVISHAVSGSVRQRLRKR